MDKKNLLKKIITELARLILGVTFLFSGFVKAVDPYGTAYKIEDYLAAFNLSSLSSLAFLASCFLCLLEFLMGAFMLLGIYRKWTSRLILLTMLFMTPLTFYLAVADPVADCGCFGDFLVISNWETFYKNIVLLACAFVVLFNYERIMNLFTGKTYWIAFLYTVTISIIFIFYNSIFEPIFDFRPYKIGANIPELMDVEEGKGRIEETILIYSKDGVEKEFSDQNAPWEDESWIFERMETNLISEGEVPVIHDLSISKLILDKTKTELDTVMDITLDVLTDDNYVFLMISPLFSKMSMNYISHFEDVADYAREHDYAFYCLTATGPSEILEWKEQNVTNFDFCNTDERTLKTIMRSNPGLMLLKNGIVLNKWADIEVPAEEDLVAPLTELSLGAEINPAEKDKTNMIYISALFILPLFGLKLVDFVFFWKNPERKKKRDQKKQTVEDN